MTEKKLPYMQFYPKAYLADTRRLSCLEHGLYCQILFMMWENKGVLWFDESVLAYETGLTIDEFTKAWGNVKRFFQIKKGKLYNDRITKDLQDKKTISKERASAAKKRWDEKNNNNNKLSNAIALQSDANKEPEPEPILSDKSLNTQSANFDLDFNEFWAAYPLKEDKKPARAKYEKARKDYSHAVIMAGLAQYKQTKPDWQQWKLATTFLNKESFTNEPPNTNTAPRPSTNAPRPNTQSFERISTLFEAGMEAIDKQ